MEQVKHQLYMLFRLLSMRSGEISLNGVNITGVEAHKLVSQGMAHVPEGRRGYQLTVLENLKWVHT